MKTYFPSFYSEFQCLAGACPDTCCAKWELPVDEKSEAYFRSLSTPFGKRIADTIALDEDGDSYFPLKDGRCPFLDADNLCEIRKELGHEHTCEVCRQHPDFIEEYDDFTEICPSLSCPAAAPLIFSVTASYPQHSSDSPDVWLVTLCNLRNEILSLQEKEYSAFAQAAINAVYSAENRFLLDYPEEDLPLEMNEEAYYPDDAEQLQYFDEITALFLRLEILTDEWKTMLEKSVAADESSVLTAVASDWEQIALFRYLLFRYFLKAVNGYSAAGITRLLMYIVSAITSWAAICGSSFTEVARLCSKEIEHNPENIFAIAAYFLS